ncbi:MAG TPA: MFS transporter [Methylomusa anaerophila]|uniref:Enterobactin exporter EntS n=2 Tax=Methylomusa anaerophila TaxID=1930071 RepID=A0A348AIP7_9FIRM|nr:MFS transporter [Methylomusa anaerophila]BBB90945.1 enterobactin exporter EntS [Methylomusa anaerophila]HML90428.1 MFS transporter [Methylomusa anaerophila]
MLRALRHRNFRLFFFGQGISLIGTWMQRTAIVWLVYRLTGSAQVLGTVDFLGQISGLVLIPFAGVMLDRCDRYKVVITTQVFSLLQATVLAALVLSQMIAVWQIVLLSIVLGMVNSFDMPARQSFISQIVDDKEDLSNAIALNSAMFNGARIIGPSVAGLAISAFGEGWCFLINAVSFAAVLVGLGLMQVNRLDAVNSCEENLMEGFRQGISYTYHVVPIRMALALLALISLAGMPVMVLMPIFAGEVLAGGADILGLLMSFFGMGALAGTIFLASRKTVLGLENIIVAGGSVFGIGLTVFAASKVLWLSLVLAFVMGIGLIVHMAATNTIIQTLVDEDKRGRVMSLYILSFGGIAPFGSLLGGYLAEFIGVSATFLTCGAICLAGIAAFAYARPVWRSHAEPIFRDKGLICED